MAAPLFSRFHRTVAVTLVATAAVALCGSCARGSKDVTAEGCAILPDSVGLYVENPVTQMGFQIGKITSITPETLDVRVKFTVKDRALPKDVRAVVRSTSILSDRVLELVGNYDSGARLAPNECIPLDQSFTPKSLSQVIGASTDFVNAISPSGSTNVGDVVGALDQSVRDQGQGINNLLTKSSSVLDSPDQAIGDIGSIVSNLSQLTSTFREVNPTLKGVLQDLNQSGPDVANALYGGDDVFEGLVPLLPMISDIETQLGPELQQTLDVVSAFVRKASPRAPLYSRLLDPGPRYINGLANLFNNHQFSISYRPPLYRIRTPDGVLTCNVMNASVPGSCANVNGTPYAVDVALLQYVLTQAGR